MLSNMISYFGIYIVVVPTYDLNISMISYVGTMTSYLITYDFIYMTSHPIYFYDIIYWNYDIMFTNL